METRRSGNYEASTWDDDFVQSITSPYAAKEYLEKVKKMKNMVKRILEDKQDQLDQLELIDSLQRLDISHLFNDAIVRILKHMYLTVESQKMIKAEALYLTALRFRILRQHGYLVPQDVFCSFMDDEGHHFDAELLSDDTKGIMALYEASFLSMEGENLLDMAKEFSTHQLQKMLEKITDPNLSEQIRHALEIPLHWRVQKLEAKWFIHVYAFKFGMNLSLLELAKLDFNVTQANYQDEIKQLSRWYKGTGLEEKLKFARHRLVECYLWAVGFIPEYHIGYPRKILTKIAVFITIMDDIYDVYGTLDELTMLTDAIDRWDINALDCLPEYMMIFFLGLFNCTNELSYDILKKQGLSIISNLRRLWGELSRAYYTEARWYNSGYIPTMNEYLTTSWVSISGPILLFHAYFTIADPINKKELRNLEKIDGIIHWPSLVLRLTDDIGTTSAEIEKGDVPKSIQCYMHETGCSEDVARKYIKNLIDVALKKMNKEILMESPIKSLVPAAMNLARIAQCFYQYGDGFGVPHKETKKNLVSLILEPIQI